MAEHTQKERKIDDWVDFRKIKEGVALETVLLRLGLLEKMTKSGDEWIGPCPLHENRPGKKSFYANVKKNTFHCFACKQSGNVLDLTAKVQRVNLKTAGIWLWQFLPEVANQKQERVGDPIDKLRESVDAVVGFLVSRVEQEQQIEQREHVVRGITDIVLATLRKL